MSILDFIQKEDSSKYISLKEAINLLTEKTNSTIQEVAIYLLNKDVPQELACHTKCSDYKIKETSGKKYDYGMFRSYGRNWAHEYLTNISERHNCTNWTDLNSYSAGHWDDWGVLFNDGNIGLLENTYWYRQAFYNFEFIKSLDLFAEKLLESNPLLIPIWDDNYLNIQLADNSPFLDINEDQYLSYSFSIEDVEYTDERWMNKSAQQIKSHPLYFKNKTFSVHEATCLMVGYSPIETQWEYQNVNWLIDNPKYEESSNFILAAVKTSLFEEFSNGEYFITSDNLKILLTESGHFIDGFNERESNASNDENLTLNEKIKNTIAISNLELDIAIEKMNVRELNEEIEKLKKQLQAKDARIKELELLQVESNSDLISLIFDETITERYAPDLVSSIMLWKHTYITSPKDDSHSNKADTWLKHNTGYDTAKKAGSASKIREVTAPFIKWSTHRDKAYKKQI